VLWYKFDETSGNSAADSSGNGRTGTLAIIGGGNAAFSTTHQVGTGSLRLTGTSATDGGYVVIPASLADMGATTEVTFACWVRVSTLGNWSRVFDFGFGRDAGYIFLAVDQDQTTPDAPRFGISKVSYDDQQSIDMASPTPLSTGAWHHFAVVLAAGATYTGTLYLDGSAVGSNSTMTLRPSDLATTTNNWLGRSQFAEDLMYDGRLDDFRIYKRALTSAEITTLYQVR